ncbi:MAG: Sua5 YciO YrdC YwlC family protein [Campylobacterales bacterium]|nr:Sua5 YciO YrdC YwlC family protein [Campylobacterales bacterium]
MAHFNELVFLTPTDTTIGFVSQNAAKISRIKERPSNKNYIQALPSLKALKNQTRLPNQYKNLVRRAKKTSFIIQGISYRIIKNHPHTLLLNRLGWAYTTSANLSGHNYDENFARQSADVIVSFPQKLALQRASNIFRLGKNKMKKIR